MMRRDQTLRAISVVILLLALAVRLTLLFGFQRYEVGRPEPIRIAISLAQHGTFANPYSVPAGLTAHTAPAYPMLIAPLYAIWGDTRNADLARFVLNALAASCEYALLPAIAISLGLGVWTGILAGFLGALIPLHYWPECIGDFETTWTALFLEVATLRFARFLQNRRWELGRALREGLFWGAGFLVSPTVLPVLLGFLAIGARRLSLKGTLVFRWLAVFAGGIAMVTGPWLVRNRVQIGGLFFVRDDLGLELFVSNHDGASAEATTNYARPYWTKAHPFSSPGVAAELRRMGELAFERQKMAQAIEWIGNHPREFLRLTATRVRTFWFPTLPRWGWLLWLATGAALVGLLLLARESRMAAVVLGSMLVGYSAIYALVQTTLRYQHPLWWIQVLLVGWLTQRCLPGALAKRAENLRSKFHQRTRQGKEQGREENPVSTGKSSQTQQYQ